MGAMQRACNKWINLTPKAAQITQGVRQEVTWLNHMT